MNDQWKERYGEWALVTGASSGIGEEFVHQLAEKGMNIILVARHVDWMNDIAAGVREKYGVETQVIEQDLIETDAAEKVKQAVGDKEVGMLINNAGYGMLGSFHKNEAKRQIDMVTLNCVAPIALMSAFINPMVERGRGAVIFLASTAAYQGTPFFSTYGASKAFNLYVGEGLWGEYKELGIDVMALSPGYTKTNFQSNAKSGKVRGIKAAKPDDVVALALRKLGKRASVVHGGSNYAGVLISRLLSRMMSTRLAGFVMKKMR